MMNLQDALDTFVYVPDDEATRIVVEVARLVVNGKHQWFCDDQKDLWDEPGCEFIYPESNHDKCGWVIVLGVTENE